MIIFRRYIPNFEYVLVDTSQYADEVLRDVKSGSLQASLFLLKYIYDERLNNHLSDVIQPLIDVSKDEVLDLLWAMLTYMTSATDNVGEAELRTTLTDVFREAEEMMMTIAEKWRLEGEEIGIRKGEEIGIRKGEEIGIRKGEEIGIRKGKQDTIVQIIESRFDAVGEDLPELIDRCDLAELDALVNVALEIKTLDEFVAKLTDLHPTETDSAEDGSDENDGN